MNQNGQYRPSFRQRIINWMQGRNGPDELYRFLIWVCLALLVINAFLSSLLLSLFTFAIIVYATFRLLSKNIAQRQLEERRFRAWKAKTVRFFRQIKNRFVNRKTSVYKKCPNCRSTLCMPRKKGYHQVTCPHCKNRFTVTI